MRRMVAVVSIAMLALAPNMRGQTAVSDSAFALFNAGKHVESVPLFERVVAAGSTDPMVYERLGMILLETSGAIADAEARRKTRVRVKTLLQKAVSLGSSDPQILVIADGIPADGGTDPTFSDSKDVDKAMNLAETAYSSGDFRSAFALYQKALSLDPKMYDAAVFSGDAYLRLQIIDSAYVWYDKATQINPNRETAWRYWSDVLLKDNRTDDALAKAIEAIVAEPYNRISRQALIAWAQNTKKSAGLPTVDLPERDTASVHSKAWLAYDSVRTEWKGTDPRGSTLFQKTYPADRAYRHSLAEEKAALLAAYKAGGDEKMVGNVKRLDDAGMLESYIFFARADQGVASEVEGYRRTHRDLMKRFWAEFVIGAPFELH